MSFFTEEEEERLRAILANLPTLNPDIADPARHEKLLSFLQSHVESGPEQVTWIVENLNALQTVQDSLSHADYRVPSLSIRFLGHLVANNTDIFPRVYGKHQQILQYIIHQLDSDDCPPPLRFACIETLRLFLKAESAAKWLLETAKLPGILLRSLLCPSLYVVTASSKLLVAVINHPVPRENEPTTFHLLSASLLVSGQLYGTLNNWLQVDADENEKLAGLELVWNLSNSKAEIAYRFLRDGELIRTCCGLLEDTDRIMRSRVFDSLKALLRWAPDPLILLQGHEAGANGYDNRTRTAQAFLYFARVYLTRSLERNTLQNLPTIFDVIEVLAVLAIRAEDDRLICWVADVLVGAFDVVHESTVPSRTIDYLDAHDNEAAELSLGTKLLSQLRQCFDTLLEAQKKARTSLVLCSIFGAIDQLAPNCKSTQIEALLKMDLAALKHQSYQEDQRLVHFLLCSLFTIVKRYGDSAPTTTIIEALVVCLQNDAFRPQNSKLALEILKWALENMHKPPEVAPDTTFTQQIIQLLQKMLGDPRWDVRDTALNFIGSLFLWEHDSVSRPSLDFAIDSALPEIVMMKIDDDEPYVRSSCLMALQQISKNPRGHIYLTTHNLELPLIRQLLTSSLKDTEAFVRRSALEVLVYLVREKHADKILFDLEHELLDGEAMRRVMEDFDSEVRLRGLKLLEALFELMDGYRDGVEEDGSPWFLDVNGDELVLAAATDPSRLVRKEAYRLINSKLLPRLSPSLPSFQNSKRRRYSDTRLASFFTRLKAVDMDRLRQTSVAEHLYQEVLDVDESVLKERERSGEGNNVLSCYDC